MGASAPILLHSHFLVVLNRTSSGCKDKPARATLGAFLFQVLDMPFSFDDWLHAHPAVAVPAGSAPAAPVHEALRGTSAWQVARWAMDGFDVTALIDANLAPDPVSHGDAWSSSWAQGFARHWATLLGQALQEGPMNKHHHLAQCWHRLNEHPQAKRFITFARHDLDHHLGTQGWVALEQRVLQSAVAGEPSDRSAPPRARL